MSGQRRDMPGSPPPALVQLHMYWAGSMPRNAVKDSTAEALWHLIQLHDVQFKLEIREAQLSTLRTSHAELLALSRQYASECAECDGEGTFDAELGFEEVCEACVDIRKIIAKAVGK